MEHIFYCKQINIEKTEVEFERIYGENLKELEYILRRFTRNLKEREKSQNFQEILNCDPLRSVSMDCSNGY